MNTPGKNANDYSVPYMWGTVGFMYNEKYVDRSEVSTWGAILNPKFEQKLFMKDAFRDVYSPLLIYLNSEGIANGTVSDISVDCNFENTTCASVPASKCTKPVSANRIPIV